MSSIDQLFSNFENLHVLIIGDVMIDRYLWGSVDRISPEAPVPVVRLQKTDDRLGGAANVALNIKALGATPYLYSVIGKDQDALQFQKLLPDHELIKSGILQSEERITTVKSRVISNAQHLIRIDQEQSDFLSTKDTDRLFQHILDLLKQQPIDVILF